MRRWIAVLSFALTGPVVACSNSSSGATSGTQASSTTSHEAKAGTYEGKLSDGSTLKVWLDVPSSDEVVAPFDDFRSKATTPDVTWIVAEISVPGGGPDATAPVITLTGAGKAPGDDGPPNNSDGTTHTEFACSMLRTWYWQGGLANPELTSVHNEVLATNCNGQALQVAAPAGKTTTYVMVYDGALPSFETITAGPDQELTST